ncbi:DNA-packaging protein [Pseudopontixanthobacter vadosimaris]|uniref:DNA-packaging protein n=1 Tax=Pseudopontixanthobacter vadosimaris TaxID=2726450 RepID=UPI001473AE39|nr:terminase family protein [Pseudopontixanthobacter vadosimaris]
MVFLSGLSDKERDDLRWHWSLWARPEQLPPPGDWSIWLICAGRGFGKTRAGAEWVQQIARHNPDARIALVGASIGEVRQVMVEGESGILAACAPHRQPEFEPSRKRIVWANGAQATIYSAAEPESLRGPQHSHAWCDEIAKWHNSAETAGTGKAMAAWDNLLMGMRLGELPRILATTTPRPVALVRRLLKEEEGSSGKGREAGGVIVTRGTTYDNWANLPDRYIRDMRRAFGGTSLGRQELEGAMLTEAEGALWSRDLIEACRMSGPSDGMALPATAFARIVVGVDPPVSAHGDECGIVVCGLDGDGIGKVLADCSVVRPTPETWARAVARTADLWGADRIVAEANQGGAMVGSVLRAADVNLPVKLVHASRGKVARAEPVAALYEAGRVRHAGLFARLEDQLCGLMAGGTYDGPGRSPDRADALVWALSELMLGSRGVPRVREI